MEGRNSESLLSGSYLEIGPGTNRVRLSRQGLLKPRPELSVTYKTKSRQLLCGDRYLKTGKFGNRYIADVGGLMQSVVGIFSSLASAEQAVEGLLGSGMTQQSIIFLSSESPDRGGTRSAEQKLETIPTTDAEPDGMGKAMGAVVGGAVGASAGLAGGGAVGRR